MWTPLIKYHVREQWTPLCIAFSGCYHQPCTCRAASGASQSKEHCASLPSRRAGRSCKTQGCPPVPRNLSLQKLTPHRLSAAWMDRGPKVSTRSSQKHLQAAGGNAYQPQPTAHPGITTRGLQYSTAPPGPRNQAHEAEDMHATAMPPV